MIDVMIKVLPGGLAPRYMSEGAAGMDCYAREGGTMRGIAEYYAGETTVSVERVRVALGFALSLPEGYEAHVRPRSGMGYNNGIHCAFGTVDADYRGEVSALLFNLGTKDFTWQPGDRICQLVIAPVARPVLHQVDELTVTGRGAGGFGSTGR